MGCGSTCAAGAQGAQSLRGEIRGPLHSKRLDLGPEDTYTDGLTCPVEASLPFGDASKGDKRGLVGQKLPPARVKPDDTLARLRAKHDHVVVRRDDDLVRTPRVGQNDLVRGPSWWRAMRFVTNMTGAEPEGVQSRGHSPRKQLVEQKPDGRTGPR